MRRVIARLAIAGMVACNGRVGVMKIDRAVVFICAVMHAVMRVLMLIRHHGCQQRLMVRGTASGLGHRRQPLQGQRGDD